MGKREFYSWVDQVYFETEGGGERGGSWDASRRDPWWEMARAKRDQELGR